MWGFFQKKPTGSEITFQVSGMHCTSCSLNIDGALEEIPGVINATTNYRSGTTQVEYEAEKVSANDMQKTIEGLGYGVETAHL
jgi:copper chaperone CopZ